MKKILLLCVIAFGIIFSGCAQSISEVKNDSLVGEEVRVKGTVTDTLKIGDLSGYTIIGESGEEIAISSKELPAEGDTVRVKGTLEKRAIIGYIIVVE